MPKPIRCIICGCHQDLACIGGCSWVSMDPPLCSACNNAEDLRNRERPADNLEHTQAMTPHRLRSYFYALEMYVAVTKPSKKHYGHGKWHVEFHGDDKTKAAKFIDLVPSLFHDAERIGHVRFLVDPEKYILVEVLEQIRKGGSHGR